MDLYKGAKEKKDFATAQELAINLFRLERDALRIFENMRLQTIQKQLS
jgi:hypothetical protein